MISIVKFLFVFFLSNHLVCYKSTNPSNIYRPIHQRNSIYNFHIKKRRTYIVLFIEKLLTKEDGQYFHCVYFTCMFSYVSIKCSIYIIWSRLCNMDGQHCSVRIILSWTWITTRSFMLFRNWVYFDRISLPLRIRGN
jgi:hypothetical protein